MPERIYASDGETVLDARRTGKLYADRGRDPDGFTRVVELTEAEQTAREEEWAAPLRGPIYRTPIVLLALIPEDERRTLFRALENLASQATAAGNTARDFLDFWRAAREIDVTGNEQVGGGITWPQAVGYMLNQGWISQATHDALVATD